MIHRTEFYESIIYSHINLKIIDNLFCGWQNVYYFSVMGQKSIKVDEDIHKEVDDHTQATGGKIGKFYDIAAKEKLAREQAVKKPFKPKYQTK